MFASCWSGKTPPLSGSLSSGASEIKSGRVGPRPPGSVPCNAEPACVRRLSHKIHACSIERSSRRHRVLTVKASTCRSPRSRGMGVRDEAIPEQILLSRTGLRHPLLPLANRRGTRRSRGPRRLHDQDALDLPDRVSGGDVLVEIAIQQPVRQSLIVSLNGRNVSSAFRAGRAANTVLGLVTGLSVGRNTLTVEGRGRAPPSESLALTNYPLPVRSSRVHIRLRSSARRRPSFCPSPAAI